MLRQTLLAAAVACIAIPAAAHDHSHHEKWNHRGLSLCDAHSPFDLQLSDSAITFTRSSGTPASVAMSKGRLTIDGRVVELSSADRERVADYEATVRELIPEVKAIALDAVEIAYTAVEHVARTFVSVGEVDRTAERLATLRIEMRRRIDESFVREPWNDKEFEHLVESTVEELIPVLVAEIVSTAVKVALSGDEAAANELEARADRLERTIETQVETRAHALEARAEALCPIVADLDKIEASWSVRGHDDKPLDLISLRD